MATKSSYHHGDLRAALIRHGHELLAESGPERFSLNELARRSGVSTAAPYRHFEDRDHVLDAIADDGYRVFGAALERAVEESAHEGDAVRRMLAGYLDFAERHSAYFSVMFKDRAGRPDEVGPSTFGTFATALGAAQAAGFLDSAVETAALGRALWSAVHGAAVLRAAGGFAKLGIDVPADRLVDDILEPFLRRH